MTKNKLQQDTTWVNITNIIFHKRYRHKNVHIIFHLYKIQITGKINLWY